MDNMFGKFTIEPYRTPLPAMRKECQMWCFEFFTSSNLNLCKKCQLWCVHFLHLWISWSWAHINWKMFTVYEKMYKMDQTSQKVIIHGSPPINEIVITRCFPTCFFNSKKTAESSKPHQQAVSIYINMQIMWIFRYLDFYSRYSRCIDHIYIYTLYISVLCRCIWFYDTYITHNDTRNQFLAARFQGPVRVPGGLGVTGRLVAQLPGTSHGHRICQPREGGNEPLFVKKHDLKKV